MNKCEICKKKPFHPDKKCCFNCTKSNSKCEVWHECGKDCPEWDNAIKTNADRIRAMSDEELAEFMADRNVNESTLLRLNENYELSAVQIAAIKHNVYCACMRWLKQPAEE